MNAREVQTNSSAVSSTLERTETLLRALVSDVGTLKDGRYKQAEELRRRYDDCATLNQL